MTGGRTFPDQDFLPRAEKIAALWADPQARVTLNAEVQPNSRSCWTEERVTRLLELTREGKSALEVAKILGYPCSRNSVLGKLYRLELAGKQIERPVMQRAKVTDSIMRRQPSMPGIGLTGVPAQKRGRDCNNQGMVLRSRAAAPLPEPVPFTNGARVTLLQLSSATCKWPIGDPQDRDFCFCGHAPRENSPYCEFHARSAYVPMQDRKHRVFA